MNKTMTMQRSGVIKRSNESTRIIISTIVGIIFGFFIGVSFPPVSLSSISFMSSYDASINNENVSAISAGPYVRIEDVGIRGVPKIYVSTNPRGAEPLPPGIIVPKSDLYLRRLWGEPNEDLVKAPKYLVTFTVGIKQKFIVDSAVKKFSDNFTILLFHYDGRTTEWDQFAWSRRAIHVSAKKQSKWWYAKRFLHPDIVAAYDYIFIWDEDLGLDHFNADKYMELVKKHGLEISQPGIEPNNGLTWEMTKRRGNQEFHTNTTEKPGWCSDPKLPPCAAFVEIMAPVFSRKAWGCVWHMIQNDLVHGWGIDFALRRCVEPAHEKIGVIDSQWIIHETIPTLGEKVTSTREALDGYSWILGVLGRGDAVEKEKAPPEGVRDGVRARCRNEWAEFQRRLVRADEEYFIMKGRG